jgi:Flp pilus assembly protein TadD/TolB-like protein
MAPASQHAPPRNAIKAEVEKILASETFAKAGKCRDLFHLVSIKLEPDEIRELRLGIELYGRDFDPVTDTRVRQLAREVRDKLEKYYSGPGARDRIRISIPVGGYVPHYEKIRRVPWKRLKEYVSEHRGLLLATGVAVASIVVAGWLAGRYVIPRFLHPNRHIAVLPFETVDDRPESQQFRKGLLYSVVTRLNQSARSVKRVSFERPDDVLASGITNSTRACRAFGATEVVSGSIHKAEGKTQVTVSFSRCDSPGSADSAILESQLGSPFSLEDLVAQNLADMLHLNVEAGLPSGGHLEPTAEDYYLRARGYLLEGPGGVDQAVELFRTAVETDSNSALAHAGLGEAYIRKYNVTGDAGWVKLADESSRRAAHINRELAAVRITLGLIYTTGGKYEMAVSEYQNAVRLEPNNPDAYSGLAVAYDRLGRTKDAEDIYKGAIERARYWGAYHQLGGFYYTHGRYREAEEEFRLARTLAPDNSRISANLGALYLQTARYAEAEQTLKQSIRLQPSPEAFNNLSAVYFYQRRYDDAIDPMYKAVEMKSLDARFVGNLARTYRWARRAEAAAEYKLGIQLARNGLNLNPHDIELLAELGLMLVEAGDTNGLDQIRQAHAAGPTDMRVLLRAVLANELAGNRAGALAALSAIVQNSGGCLRMEEIRRRPELDHLRMTPEYKATVAGQCSVPAK